MAFFHRNKSLDGFNNNYTAPADARNDRIKGLGGSDVINGGDGDDEILGDGEWFDLFVTPGNDTLYGGKGSDVLYGGAGHDTLYGGNDNDQLFGEGGNDRLNGEGGADMMKGGGGDDVYIVDNPGDVVQDDLLFGGTDRVESSVSYTLRDNSYIENLTLTGSNSVQATGTNYWNVINGNSGDNRLAGLGGDDTLNGYNGNDWLEGGTGNDRLDGGNGDDRLDGGEGNDVIMGGAGNDVFLISAVSGVDTLDGGSGVDRVESSVSYQLRDNNSVENLTLTGSSNAVATGNNLDNTLIGNSGANILNGGAGNDVLDGGAGCDRYLGGDGNDTLCFDFGDFGLGAGSGQYDGGTGIDTLRLRDSTTLDLRLINDDRIRNIEIIDLQASTTNTKISLKFEDVNAINAGHVLRIDGGAGDIVNIADSNWRIQSNQLSMNGQLYNAYVNGATILNIDTDIKVEVVLAGQSIDAFHG